MNKNKLISIKDIVSDTITTGIHCFNFSRRNYGGIPSYITSMIGHYIENDIKVLVVIKDYYKDLFFFKLFANLFAVNTYKLQQPYNLSELISKIDPTQYFSIKNKITENLQIHIGSDPQLDEIKNGFNFRVVVFLEGCISSKDYYNLLGQCHVLQIASIISSQTRNEKTLDLLGARFSENSFYIEYNYELCSFSITRLKSRYLPNQTYDLSFNHIFFRFD